MRFIDSINITVIAGNGGNGCVSFEKKRIRKSNFFGKPNGSNGGDGGDVWLEVDSSINTLNSFNYKRVFKAGNGLSGKSLNCTGKRGKDIIIKVPSGTRVYCCKTYVLLKDMMHNSGCRLMVAKGGAHGLGNNNFKYLWFKKNNKNIFFDKVQGAKGELRHLLLELLIIADVGVFGLPNSGKSSFVNIISNAKPKVSDYPFTTLFPTLGVIQRNSNSSENSCIVADIPGIIKGASDGLGLGIKFLKHLKRCKMLLHFVDVNPIDKSDPIKNIIDIERELSNYDIELMNKTRWLIFNKIDLLNSCEVKKKIDFIVKSIPWKYRYYAVSVKEDQNISLLCSDVLKFINFKI